MPGNLTIVLTLSPKTIAGCLDLQTTFVGEPDDEPVEKILQDVFSTLINGLVDDEVITAYETEEEAEKRISPYFRELKETMKEAEGEVEEIASFLENQGKIEADPPALPTEEEAAPSTSEEQPLINPNLTFESLPSDDPLVKKVTGDERMQELLVLLYSQIPRQFWGTDKAREFLELSIKEAK